MITTKLTRKAFLGLLLSIAAFQVGCADDAKEENGTATVTRVAILVDQSGSFVKNLPAAAQIIQRYIKENAVAGSAEIYLISVDRSPRVLGYFPAEQLLNTKRGAVLDKITATNPLDGTDIIGALRLAHTKLTKDNGSQPGRQYLLVMSDMCVDRQTNPAKAFPTLDDFDWNSLRGMDARFYFVAASKEAQVTRLLEQGGIHCPVLDQAESSDKKLAEGVEDYGE